MQRAGQNSCRRLIQRSAPQMGPGPQERAPTPQVLHRQEGRVIQGRLIPGWLTLPSLSPWPGFRTRHWSYPPQAQLNFFTPKHAHTLPSLRWAVQWLGLVLSLLGPSSVPGWRTRMPHAAPHSQNHKRAVCGPWGSHPVEWASHRAGLVPTRCSQGKQCLGNRRIPL